MLCFLCGIVSGGGEIVTPCELVDARSDVCRDFFGRIRGSGINDNNLTAEILDPIETAF